MSDSNKFNLVLVSEDEQIEIFPNEIIFFLDETGHEFFADENYPIYGLGGCGMFASYYTDFVRPNWIAIKEEFFEGAQNPLHASSLKDPTNSQLGALNTFFKELVFSRVATTIFKKANLAKEVQAHILVALSLQNRIQKALSIYDNYSSINLVFEDSERGNPIIQNYLGNFTFVEDPKGLKHPVKGFFLPKESREPGLEIADFIVQASGNETKIRQKTQTKGPIRKDFKSIWGNVDPNLLSFFQITGSQVNITKKG